MRASTQSPLAHCHVNLPQQRHDLLRAKSLLRHRKSSFPSQFLTIRLVQKEPISLVLALDMVKQANAANIAPIRWKHAMN